MSYGFNEKQLGLIIDILSQFPEVDEAIVFGSRAMGNFKNGSDVDIALKGSIDENIVTKISRRLNDESPLPHIFDIVDYHTISSADLITHIDSFGKILYHRGV